MFASVLIATMPCSSIVYPTPTSFDIHLVHFQLFQRLCKSFFPSGVVHQSPSIFVKKLVCTAHAPFPPFVRSFHVFEWSYFRYHVVKRNPYCHYVRGDKIKIRTVSMKGQRTGSGWFAPYLVRSYSCTMCPTRHIGHQFTQHGGTDDGSKSSVGVTYVYHLNGSFAGFPRIL